MLKKVLWTISLVMALGSSVVLPAMAAGRIIDDNDRTVLSGNVHVNARAEYDAGAADAALPLDRMILTLRLTPEKQTSLVRLLAEQQNPASPNYRRWLTPEEYGAQFGPTPADVAAATGWLASQGFTVQEVAKSGAWINFSGTAGTVERAFRSQIRNYTVNGRLHHANAQNPSIPRGLADLVGGVVTLHDFPRTAMNHGIRPLAQAGSQPQYTVGSTHNLSPGDFATIYNVTPLYNAGIDGTGQVIAIVGRTHPSATNWSNFRSKMGLPVNPPQVILNGTDPGDLGSGEDGEADLDVEWSGAVAKNATIKFVVSKSTASTDGVDLSAQYIVNNNLAPVMSTSFGLCEAQMSAAENLFYNNLWSQAASQGITSFVSTGDSGVAGCSSGSATSGSGKGINGLASTPYNVAVGGTQFSDGAGGYWGSANVNYASALGYIPEVAWNESGSVSGGSGLWATSGGASSIYAKPTWQVAPGVPADGKRDIPDVSLTASSYDGYLVQTQGALYVIGGTSAASPSFAGLMALIVQKTGQRQGNANIRFYQLGAAQYNGAGPAVYHDATSGSNTVPGVTGYSCTVGYDQATGLGSVDATALAANWAVVATPDFTVTVSPASVSVVQGGSASTTVTNAVVGGYSSAVSFSVAGLPAGSTATLSSATLAAPGSGSVTLTLATTSVTPTGSYPVIVTATDGTTVHTATISLTVAAAPVPGFTVVISPTSVSAVQGASAVVTVTTSVSGGFSNAVTLSATGLPTGATATFSTATVAAPGSGSATLTLAVSSATAAGTYPVTVTATGGTSSHTATLSLTVTVAGSASTLFNDGFEGTGWVTTQLSGTQGGWTLVAAGKYPTVLPHGGAKLADFNSYTSKSGSQTRIYRSAGFAVPTTVTKVTLTYWMYHDSIYSNNDRIQPQVSSNGSVWSNVGSAVSRYNGTTGWAQVSVDLTSYKGKTVYLGFVGISAFGNDIYLDDVAVAAQ